MLIDATSRQICRASDALTIDSAARAGVAHFRAFLLQVCACAAAVILPTIRCALEFRISPPSKFYFTRITK